jgi:hypothetical protein
MKTQILRLEQHDDIISTRDKMGWGQTSRIVLVWPERGRILTRKLDLVLLLRQCARLGSQLALVTDDADVRFNASQLRIPVFNSLRQAQASSWKGGGRYKKRPSRHKPRPDFYSLREEVRPTNPTWLQKPAARWGFFSLGILALLALCAFIFPGAYISLEPQVKEQEILLTIRTDPKIQAASLSGKVPAHLVAIIVEGRNSLESTGSLVAPEKTATTRLRFTNQTDGDVTLPAGLMVTTLAGPNRRPVRFETLESGVVPAGVGQSKDLPAQAITPGIEGNLPANTLVAIEGPFGLKVSVTNPSSARGGTSLPVLSPDPRDYDKLFEQLVASLEETALQEISLQLDPGDLIITPSLTLSQTLEANYLPPMAESGSAQPSSQLGLLLRLEYQVLVVSGEDLQYISNAALEANRPQGFNPLDGKVDLQHLSQPVEVDDGSYQWRIRARQLVQAIVDRDQVRKLIRGTPLIQARQILRSEIPLKSPPLITLAPRWWPRIPLLPLRITISSG